MVIKTNKGGSPKSVILAYIAMHQVNGCAANVLLSL
jgi:hypothetical protein